MFVGTMRYNVCEWRCYVCTSLNYSGVEFVIVDTLRCNVSVLGVNLVYLR